METIISFDLFLWGVVYKQVTQTFVGHPVLPRNYTSGFAAASMRILMIRFVPLEFEIE